MADEIGDVVLENSPSDSLWTDMPEFSDVSQKKDAKQKPIVQLIGYVDSIRKIQTKKWENMLIVACSAIDWKFTTVVFPKFYSAVAHNIIEWEIICVKWKLSLKPEMKEISLEAEQVRRATISQLRKQQK